ncbi:MAG: MarR family transcriptional regulator [Streptosporangiaceae bacterium]
MSEPGGSWTLLTGHGHVLVEIARNPEARIRDISAAAGLTERAVQAIVADLEAAGYLTRTRTGRRTVYTVNPDSLFRHSAQEGLRVGPFLDLLAADEDHSAAAALAEGPGLGGPGPLAADEDHSAAAALGEGPGLGDPGPLATDEDHSAAAQPGGWPGLGDLGQAALSARSGDADHDQASIVGGVGDGAGEDAVGLSGGGQPPGPPAL